jgi:hypothetical protein
MDSAEMLAYLISEGVQPFAALGEPGGENAAVFHINSTLRFDAFVTETLLKRSVHKVIVFVLNRPAARHPIAGR